MGFEGFREFQDIRISKARYWSNSSTYKQFS